jgi:hypothetical protein
MRGAENLRYGAVLQSFSRVTIPVLSLLVPLSSVRGGAPWQQGGNETTRWTYREPPSDPEATPTPVMKLMRPRYRRVATGLPTAVAVTSTRCGACFVGATL